MSSVSTFQVTQHIVSEEHTQNRLSYQVFAEPDSLICNDMHTAKLSELFYTLRM